jgi:hypothetical protein
MHAILALSVHENAAFVEKSSGRFLVGFDRTRSLRVKKLATSQSKAMSIMLDIDG